MSKVTRLTLDEEGGLQNRRIHLREISGDADTPLETVGQDLRAARLRRGDDLASVSRVLKIRKDHLEALEEDRPEALPGRTYAIGFIRGYAEYLGLDALQCVERYKAEIAGRAEMLTPVHVIDEDDTRRLPQGWLIMAGVVGILLVYGAYHLWVSADQMLNQPGTPAPPTVVAKVHPQKHVQTSPAVATPATGPSQQPSGPASIQGSASAPNPGAGPGGANAGTTANNGQTAALSPPATNAAPPGLAPLPPGQVYGEQNRNPRVILRVHEATRLLVQGPHGATFMNHVLKPGDTYQVPNQVGLTLTTPNGSAVEIELDGASMGFAGKNKQITEALSLDPQAIVDHYNGGGG
jgi:cytoskeleton protein RodZ